MPVERSCGAIVFKKNDEIKYLLLQYNPKYWGFVKGLNEKGESIEDTIRRELREETGISEARFVGDFEDKVSYFYRRGGKTIYKEVIYRLMQTDSDEVKLSYEHIGYAWLPYEEALNRLRYKSAKNLLKKAHEYIKRVLKNEEAVSRQISR
ncbi:diadenosine tetraphosphate hydrolase [Candidatus Bathyarchaeota archaeon B24-2]|nr:MAG: diadenosine tetraphosphate hydrolase [Candidatus Bathyarchaeota archaeon B24-2]